MQDSENDFVISSLPLSFKQGKYARFFAPFLSIKKTSWRIAMLLLIMCLCLVLVLSFVRAQTSTPYRILKPASTGLACVKGSSWSPDGTQIALFGFQHACSVPGVYNKGIIAVYANPSGDLVNHFAPDSLILTSLKSRYPLITLPQGTTASGLSVPLITYHSIIWATKTHPMLLLFDIQVEQPALQLRGLLLIQANSIPFKTILQPWNGPSTYVEWNISQENVIAVKKFPDNMVPIAFTYQWNTEGALQPDQSINPSGTQTICHPIGNPQGDGSFALWQSGYLEYRTRLDYAGAQQYLPGVYTWQSTFVAVSPDGNYVIDGVPLKARLVPEGEPTPSNEAITTLVGSQSAIPIRDSGLLQIIYEDNRANVKRGVAWSPDGNHIAETDFTSTITISGCTSGTHISSLSIPNLPTFFAATNTLISWSSSGHSLFFLSTKGIALLWQVN